MFRGESKPLVSKPQGRSPLSIFSCLAPGQRGGPPSPSALPTSLPSRLPQLRGCACRQAMQLLTLGEKEVGDVVLATPPARENREHRSRGRGACPRSWRGRLQRGAPT